MRMNWIVRCFVVGAALVLLAAPSLFAAGASEEETAELSLGLVPAMPSQRVANLAPRFTEETGIQIEVEQHRAPDLVARIRLESAGQTGYYDIIRTGTGNIDLWIEPGYVLSLDDYIAATPEFEIDDFQPDIVDAVARGDDGQLYGLPLNVSLFLVAYRTDLFEDPAEQQAFYDEYGYELAPPTTTDEWLDTAEFFTRDTTGDGDTDLFGYATSQREPMGHFWPWWMVSTFGAEFLNLDDYTTGIDDPRAYAAFEWMLEMQEFMPEGVMGLPWLEEAQLFKDGRLAMATVPSGGAFDLLDPEQSEYHDVTGFVPIPMYPNNNRGYETGTSHLAGGTLSIHAHSRNPDVAWEFLSWILSPEMSLEQARMGTFVPRSSVMANEALVDAVPELGRILPAYNAMLDGGATVMRPAIPEGGAILETLAFEWSSVAAGDKSIESAIADIESTVLSILEEGGYR